MTPVPVNLDPSLDERIMELRDANGKILASIVNLLPIYAFASSEPLESAYPPRPTDRDIRRIQDAAILAIATVFATRPALRATQGFKVHLTKEVFDALDDICRLIFFGRPGDTP